jgi:hypothetical protein
VAAGDSGCEAYTAIAWGVGLSHERSYIAGAESFYSLEGNMCGTATRGADALPGSNGPSDDRPICRSAAPAIKRRTALSGEIAPKPLVLDAKPVLQLRKKHQVNKEPGQPSREPGQP